VQAFISKISNDEVQINEYKPAEPFCFFLSLRIQIGSNEGSGADDFELGVCTADWLSQNLYEPLWGRHLLIVREYDFASIEKSIRNYVEQCHGDNWNIIAEKLGRVFAWEFEDYRQ
jgi:hypothetical protein